MTPTRRALIQSAALFAGAPCACLAQVSTACCTIPEAPADAVHIQLTTGDPTAFHALAGRLFGAAFLDVEQVDLGLAVR